jgi:hypothetical protein
MSKKSVTQESYKLAASNTSETVQRHAQRLADIARCLSVSKDFSPCTMTEMRAALSDIRSLQEALKDMVSISVARGCTHYEEQKEALLDGTLRLNRRESDQAAE